MSSIRAHRSFANVVAMLALFFALGGAALAAGNAFVSSSGVIQGCVGKSGVLYVVKTGKKCPKHTTSVPFNQKGPRGASGKNSSGGPPSGPAGGVLSGTYPDPALGARAVGPDQLQGDAVPELSDSGPGPTTVTTGTTVAGSGTGTTGTFVADAKVVLSATSAGAGLRAQAECTLQLGSTILDRGDWISPMAAVSSGYQADTTMSLEAPVSVTASSAGTVDLDCTNLGDAGVTTKAYYAYVIVTRTTSNN